MGRMTAPLDLDRTKQRAQDTGTAIEKVVEQVRLWENEWFRLAGGHTGPIGNALDSARLMLVEAGIQLTLVPALVAELRAARALVEPLRVIVLAYKGLPSTAWPAGLGAAASALAAYDKLTKGGGAS